MRISATTPLKDTKIDSIVTTLTRNSLRILLYIQQVTKGKLLGQCTDGIILGQNETGMTEWIGVQNKI